jgi:hypothetical protein
MALLLVKVLATVAAGALVDHVDRTRLFAWSGVR